MSRFALSLLFLSAGLVHSLTPVCRADEPKPQVDARIPGGNIVVDRIEGDNIFLHQDLRDTAGDWFYWHFRVRGAAGKTLTFHFTKGNRSPIGVRGPAISTDSGKSWRWLGAQAVRGSSFHYAFPADAMEVRFCFAFPYLEQNLHQFLKQYDKSPHLKVQTLCQTRKGRKVELLLLGRLDGPCQHRVALTCRHHCCEMMASYVLEGIIAEVLADNDDGRWLRNNVEFFIVPMVDKDGVEDGDQGKNRKPHDHNRDYQGQSLYASVQAIRDRLPAWSAGKLRFALDMHCPSIRGGSHETIYFVGGPDEKKWREVGQFCNLLESTQTGPLVYRSKNNLAFGQEWNNKANYTTGKPFAHWAAELPGVVAATTIEVAYANAEGREVTDISARTLGRDLARALRKYLQTDSSNSPVREWTNLPPNTWTLIHKEGPEGGKAFAQAVLAEDFDRIYLWGTGGKMRNRSTYDRYELESLSLADGEPTWGEALPRSKQQAWAGGKWQPFRLYGQEGTDGLRMMLVGSMQPNVLQFFETDGVQRPSPILTFHQACYDSMRLRVVYYGGGKTIALDPASNTWTDLAPTKTPIACRSLAWGSQCYDPINDEILLFGGGLAFNREGGARTWLYDCKKNEWYRPKIEGEEPTPRCTTPIVYDRATQSMVLFGGYDQAAALNDTWVYRCKDRRWERRQPKLSPPPMFTVAAAPLPDGRVLICGSNALAGIETQQASWDPKETWVYDIARDTWQPIGTLKLPGHWLTATSSAKHGVVFLVTFHSSGRQTYAFRYDPAAVDPAASMPLKGAGPGTLRFKYPQQRESLANAPKPDPKAHTKVLAELPVNQFVDAKPPGVLVSKTWSGATIDTDRGEVIYTGGGHSGYSGNDIATYSIAENRWTLDAPPRFPPFLESTNSAVYGWSYNARPWSQHTYLWYGYDPISKQVIYCAQPNIRNGESVLLDTDPTQAFLYDSKKHGHWTWLFDPTTHKLSLPSFGRSFGNPWDLCLTATPRGVHACTRDNLYLAVVRDTQVEWKPLGGSLPASKSKQYNYEWLPIVYDSKRDRLIHLMGGPDLVEVHVRGMSEKVWSELKVTGSAAAGRELAYLPRWDALLLLSHDRLFTLDLTANTWRELDVTMPKGVYGTEAAMVYDPKHDVSVLLLPSRTNGPLQTFLFRLDPRTVKYKVRSVLPPE